MLVYSALGELYYAYYYYYYVSTQEVLGGLTGEKVET